jgi:hypothetical protein
MYHTRMTPLQTHHTYVDPVATRLVRNNFDLDSIGYPVVCLCIGTPKIRIHGNVAQNCGNWVEFTEKLEF